MNTAILNVYCVYMCAYVHVCAGTCGDPKSRTSIKLALGSVMSALSRMRRWFLFLQERSPQFTQVLFPIPSLAIGSAAQQAKAGRKSKALWTQHLCETGQGCSLSVRVSHLAYLMSLWCLGDDPWADLEDGCVALKNKMSPGKYGSLSLSKPRQRDVLHLYFLGFGLGSPCAI